MEASFKKNLVQPEYLCSLTKEGYEALPTWYAESAKFSQKMGRKKGRNNKPPKGKDKQHVSPTTSGKKARGSSNDLGHVSPSTRRTGGAPQQIPGLSNLGNTCFFNAVMQNIGQSHYFRARLSSFLASPSLEVELKLPNAKTGQKFEVASAPGQLTVELHKFLSLMQEGGGRTLNPRPVFSEISKQASRFAGYKQQDSQELLRYLLDSLRNEEIGRIKRAILNSFGVSKTSLKQLTESQKGDIRAYGMQAHVVQTFVDDVFGGTLVSTVQCDDCASCAVMQESFLDLSLPISEEKGTVEVSDPWGYQAYNKKGGKEGRGGGGGKSEHPQLPDENVQNTQKMSKHQMKKMQREAKKNAKRARKSNKGIQEINQMEESIGEDITDDTLARTEAGEQGEALGRGANGDNDVRTNMGSSRDAESARNYGGEVVRAGAEGAVNHGDSVVGEDTPLSPPPSAGQVDAAVSEAMDVAVAAAPALVHSGPATPPSNPVTQQSDSPTSDSQYSSDRAPMSSAIMPDGSTNLQCNPATSTTDIRHDPAPLTDHTIDLASLTYLQKHPAPSTDLQYDLPPTTDLQYDPTPSTDLQHNPTPSTDLQHDPAPSTDQHNPTPSTYLQHDPAPSTDLQHDPTPSTDQHDPTLSTDLQHNPTPSTDLQHNPTPSTYLQHDPTPSTDLQHDHTTSTDFQHNSTPSTDLQHDSAPSTDLQHDPAPSTDLEHNPAPSTDSSAKRPPTSDSQHGPTPDGKDDPFPGSVSDRVEIASDQPPAIITSNYAASGPQHDGKVAFQLNENGLPSEQTGLDEITEKIGELCTDASAVAENQQGGGDLEVSTLTSDIRGDQEAALGTQDSQPPSDASQESKKDSLLFSLRKFCTPEHLTGDNKFACAVCTKKLAGKGVGGKGLSVGGLEGCEGGHGDGVEGGRCGKDEDGRDEGGVVGRGDGEGGGSCDVAGEDEEGEASQGGEGEGRDKDSTSSSDSDGEVVFQRSREPSVAESHDSGNVKGDTKPEPKIAFCDATKQFLIQKPPLVLTLHLKRFSHQGRRLKKNNAHISFPSQLDLMPFCTEDCQAMCDSNGTLMYSLYGVVVHSGGLLNGHYVAYTRTRDAATMATPTSQATPTTPSRRRQQAEVEEEVEEKQDSIPSATPPLDQSCPQRWFDYSSTKGQWYFASDSHVRIATEAEAMKSQAYLLFYERLPLEAKSK